MSPRKPKGLDERYARQFCDGSVVVAYAHRPPYPDEVFDILAGPIRDEPRRVLDIGCGRGACARRLIERADGIDAVDVSVGMIDAGKRLPGGDDPRLHWICDRAEDVSLDPPYALATAASSLHWMDWDVETPLPRPPWPLHRRPGGIKIPISGSQAQFFNPYRSSGLPPQMAGPTDAPSDGAVKRRAREFPNTALNWRFQSRNCGQHLSRQGLKNDPALKC